MKKITQKQLAFYKLYKAREENPDRFVPTWEFVGEIPIEEFGRWEMMSYKCPTRLTDIFQENPNLLERENFKGKSGARYYRYRFSKTVSKDKILDKKLLDFYKELRVYKNKK